MCCIFFFFNDTPTTEIYTLSLHDALPIYGKTVVFEVSKDANKVDIKRAIEKLLGAKVADVRTSITRGKLKRQGRYVGRRSDWKKAYVTLRAGEKLPDFLEGA